MYMYMYMYYFMHPSKELGPSLVAVSSSLVNSWVSFNTRAMKCTVHHYSGCVNNCSGL